MVLHSIFPFLRWAGGYTPSRFRADFVAGLTVALVLIPQSMAYAQLAGLPAYYGLYAAFLPPVVAALFGSSHQLATGPVAIVSLMTSTALEPVATLGSREFIAYAILLALLVGLFQLGLGVLRLGLVVNLLSHPVVTGFTNAAAIIIATSQLAPLLGVSVDASRYHCQTVWNVIVTAMEYTHWPTLALGAFAFVLMVMLKRVNPRIPYVLVAAAGATVISWLIGFEYKVTVPLERIEPRIVTETVRRYNAPAVEIETKAQERIRLNEQIHANKRPFSAHSMETIRLRDEKAILDLQVQRLKDETCDQRCVLRRFLFCGIPQSDGTLRFGLRDYERREKGDGRTWRIKVGEGRLDENEITLSAGGAVVGHIPQGLPRLSLPHVNSSVLPSVAVAAVIISLIGFMEAISISKAMATRTGQRLDPNQELIGQGLANIIGSIAQSYPVSGSFSRSAVNLQAGAVTGLSSVFSSGVVLLTLLFLTPLLYHMPQAVLAAIIMMAVLGLINVRSFVHHWRARRSCGVIALTTFVGTLALAPDLDKGILIGVVLTVAVFLLKNMKPAIALLSKYTDGAYRSAERWGLETCHRIAVIRFNGSLFFASVSYLEEAILDRVATMPEVKHILIVGNGINEMDASGEDMLSKLVDRLREAGYDLAMSGLNDLVLDVMKRTGLYEKIGRENFYPNVVTAVNVICFGQYECSRATECPLKYVRFKAPMPT
ncbi:STAS domain-containing protein [Candidatus Sumerlaeota bacterium]|nr:STAS domain-containing protein [Candidatus Sumerlaeota bacterium]